MESNRSARGSHLAVCDHHFGPRKGNVLQNRHPPLAHGHLLRHPAPPCAGQQRLRAGHVLHLHFILLPALHLPRQRPYPLDLAAGSHVPGCGRRRRLRQFPRHLQRRPGPGRSALLFTGLPDDLRLSASVLRHPGPFRRQVSPHLGRSLRRTAHPHPGPHGADHLLLPVGAEYRLQLL